MAVDRRVVKQQGVNTACGDRIFLHLILWFDDSLQRDDCGKSERASFGGLYVSLSKLCLVKPGSDYRSHQFFKTEFIDKSL